MMALQTRRPTGAVPWPLVLIEGGEKTGKSWTLAVLSSSPRVSATYWIDFGEGSADEYGAIPGANYEIVVHDGSFDALYTAVCDIRDLAQRALDAGEKPVVLGIDSMFSEWELLKDFARNRAMGSKSNKAKLKEDPLAEIVISRNHWNDANSRHRKLMKVLMTFPGIVVMTGRGKWVSATDDKGNPIENQKVYTLETQKDLGYDASLWIRLSRDHKPMVVGCRSVHVGIRAGIDEPKHLPDDWTLEHVIFDLLRCDPATAHVRDLVTPKPERTPEQIRDEAILPATTPARLRELYTEAKTMLAMLVENEAQPPAEEALGDLLIRLGKARTGAAVQAAPDGPSEKQHSHMHALWREAGFDGDRDGRLTFTAEIIGRDVLSSKELTPAEADLVIERLKAFIKQSVPEGAAS